MIATIKVIHTANDDVLTVPARTPVRAVRASLRDAFNLPPTVLALVNGGPVGAAHALADRDVLEFVVPWGRKGADRPRLTLSEYGTIDITGGVPEGLVHVDVPRIGPTCKRLGIEYGKAVVDWTGVGRRRGGKNYPVFSGVVIRSEDRPRLMAALDEKAKKRQQAVDRLPVLAALFTLNRRAKRCRDLAQSYYQGRMHGFAGDMKREKDRIYALKGQALHHLVEAGVLVGGTYHRFQFGNWAEVLEGQGYRFHRPCPPREPGDGDLIESVEAKPKEAGEPSVEIAYEVVRRFLAGKKWVAEYQWPAKVRQPRHRRYDDDIEDDGEWEGEE